MKKLVLITVLVMAMAVGANAQIKPALYVGGGLGMPMSPDMFKDYWTMGFNFGGGVGFEINPNIEVIGKFFYNTFPTDDEKFVSYLEMMYGETAPADLELDGGSLNLMNFGADVKYTFTMGEESMFAPYLLAGVGMTSVSFSDVTASTGGESETLEISESETKISLNFGAGFVYQFNPKMGFWMDARYAMVMTEGDSITYLPFRAGLKIALGGE